MEAPAPDFLDARFFHYRLLVDGRFQALTEMVAGLSPEASEGNRQAVRSLTQFQSSLQEVTLQGSVALSHLARFLTYSSIALEGLTAAVFLLPTTGRRAALQRRLRHLLLLAFVLSTYAIAPVFGFGWLLLVMGLAHTWGTSRIAWAYPITFLFLQLYRAPWSGLLGL